MGLFLYQGLAKPVFVPAAAPDLSWLPVYPDRPTSAARPKASRAPSLFFVPIAVPTDVRVSQLVAEAATQYSSAALLTRTSQVTAEVIHAYLVTLRKVRVSQMAVEIARPFGCQPFVPPLPPPCPVEFAVDTAPADHNCPEDLPVD